MFTDTLKIKQQLRLTNSTSAHINLANDKLSVINENLILHRIIKLKKRTYLKEGSPIKYNIPFTCDKFLKQTRSGLRIQV